MFRHTVVAVDFSPAWAQLRERLARLREVHGARQVTLVHVLGARYAAAPQETHCEHYEQRLSHLAGELGDAGWQADSEVRRGEPAAELIAAAQERGADLLLLGSRGHGRLHEFLLGSTALDTARLTPIPMWLEPIHDGNAPEATGLLLLATDASVAARAAESCFRVLLPRLDSGMTITVPPDEGEGDDGRACLAAHLARLAEEQPEIETRLLEGDPATAITDFAHRHGADITVIGKRGHTSLAERLLGSTAEHICRRARRPVLLVPEGWRD